MRIVAFAIAALGVASQDANPGANPWQSADSSSCANRGDVSDGDQQPVIYSHDYACDSSYPPSAWQKKRAGADGADYDLIIVGAGIGSAYLVDRIQEEFERANQEPPKIAMFERAPVVGGRMVSSWGSGALGQSVQPRSGNDGGGDHLLQEFGAMRTDPFKYPLLYNKILQEGQRLFGKENCLSAEDCRVGENCCPGMLLHMEVAGARYATTRTDLGPYMGNSSVFTPSESHKIQGGKVVGSYSLKDIEQGIGSPFDKCVQLIVACQEYAKTLSFRQLVSTLWEPFVTDLCAKCDELQSTIPGLCGLCANFPKPAQAVISCSGYDLNIDVTAAAMVLGLMDGVLNVNQETHLYLLRQGFQRFAMGLLRRGDESGIAPHFVRTVTGISAEPVEAVTISSTASLAQVQVDSLDAKIQTDAVPSDHVVTVELADGSKSTARAVYMTVLPYDLPAVKNLHPWLPALHNSTNRVMASRLFLGWKDPSKALPQALGMTPCDPGPCQRVILDGPNEDKWVVRQLWLWNNRTAMIYDISSREGYSPAHMMNIAKQQGMDALISQVMREIRSATGLTDLDGSLSDPDWARMKPWPMGSFLSWDDRRMGMVYNTSANQFASHISRPLGYDVPVFYGNSEVSGNRFLHGWAEGSLVMVEDSLQSLATYLGLNGAVQSPSRKPINVGEKMKNQTTDGEAENGSSQGGDDADSSSSHFSHGMIAVAFFVAVSSAELIF